MGVVVRWAGRDGGINCARPGLTCRCRACRAKEGDQPLAAWLYSAARRGLMFATYTAIHSPQPTSATVQLPGYGACVLPASCICIPHACSNPANLANSTWRLRSSTSIISNSSAHHALHRPRTSTQNRRLLLLLCFPISSPSNTSPVHRLSRSSCLRQFDRDTNDATAEPT